ncbi:hypothetical protein SAMN05443246_4845 [Paenibacillus sp. GP183]|nr:hypothetical protein SAMN05443246_4845 [Paenibacillus sp. GP183]
MAQEGLITVKAPTEGAFFMVNLFCEVLTA